jgi:hypothetical protein
MKNVCPMNGLEFYDRCKVVDCWFNSTDKHPSGCAKICLNDKDQLQLADLAYLSGTSMQTVENSVNAGKKKLEAWLELFNVVVSSVETAKYRCLKCGIGRSTKIIQCLNVQKCQERQRIICSLDIPQIREVLNTDLASHQIYAISRLNPNMLEALGLAEMHKLWADTLSLNGENYGKVYPDNNQ